MTPDQIRQLSAEYARGGPKSTPPRWNGEVREPSKSFPMTYSQYTKHLTSSYWKALRQKVFAERGKKCQKCGKTGVVMGLHHVTYKRLGRETPRDVRVLCSTCHANLHQLSWQITNLKKTGIFLPPRETWQDVMKEMK